MLKPHILKIVYSECPQINIKMIQRMYCETNTLKNSVVRKLVFILDKLFGNVYSGPGVTTLAQHRYSTQLVFLQLVS